MNRFTNEQRLQIVEFYYQNEKVHRALLPFYGQFNRSTEAAIWAIVQISHHCWTLNHQHAYVECELKKILQQYRPVLIIYYRFVAVLSNWASVTQERRKYKDWSGKPFKIQLVLQRKIFDEWALGKFPGDENCVQRRSSFLAQWVCKRIVDFGVKIRCCES